MLMDYIFRHACATIEHYHGGPVTPIEYNWITKTSSHRVGQVNERSASFYDIGSFDSNKIYYIVMKLKTL